MLRSLRANENLHIVLWLLKDLCWLMGFKVMGAVIFVPTVLMAVWIAWRNRAETSELLHSAAVVFWIMANGVWMLGEFWYADTKRQYAVPFFIMGLFLIACYYLVLRPKQLRAGRGA